MKTSEAFWMFLPTGLEELFEMDTLAAAIPGTKSDAIISVVISVISRMTRRKVKEITCDVSPSMMLIAGEVFYNANVVNDRFNVQQVNNEAADEIRFRSYRSDNYNIYWGIK